MKKITLGLISMALIASPAYAMTVKELFNKLDTNHNHVLEKSELLAAPHCKVDLFNAADENHDGVIQLDEFWSNHHYFGSCN